QSRAVRRRQSFCEKRIELCLTAGFQQRPQRLRQRLDPRGGNIDNARIGDRGSNPLLESDCTRNPVSSLADALNGDAFRIEIRTGERKVDHGRNDLLPVRTEIQLLLPERIALPRSIKGETVITASRRAGPSPQPHVQQRSVASVTEDEKRTPACAA